MADPGGVTTGGQIYVADAENVRVTSNIIAGHPCDNCYRSHHVNAIEIGETSPASPGVHRLTIDHNVGIGTNEGGFAIQQNRGPVVSDVTINDNRIAGYGRLDSVTANAVRARNTLDATRLTPMTASGLVRSPRPGAPTTPIFLCERRLKSAQHFTSTAKDCGGEGDIIAILGFPPA